MKTALTLLASMSASVSPAGDSLADRSVALAAEPDTTINIHDFAFAPGSITVTAGTIVHWKNQDGEPHTVRSVESEFRSNPLDENDSFTYKFDKPGTYRYVCSIHPQMTGTIVVKPR